LLTPDEGLLFGDFQVLPTHNELLIEGVRNPISPRAMEVLVHLITNNDRVVSIDELLETFWPGLVVEESTVHRVICQIRSALGDSANEPKYIKTVNKRGYLAIAQTTPVKLSRRSTDGFHNQSMAISACILVAVSAIFFYWTRYTSGEVAVPVENQEQNVGEEEIYAPNEFSIAVLPLANLSPDPNNAYFAVGIHEEILNQLVKVSQLEVKSRNSVLRFANSELSNQEIARQLNVSTVMDGSVRFAENQVSITTQLIRASDDVHLWSETYQRDYDDIFAIQSSVAIEVANAMNASLTSSELTDIKKPLTDSTQAYSLYLQAIEIERSSDAIRQGEAAARTVPLLERAIELDPSFAQAYAALASRKLAFVNGQADPARRSALANEALRSANLAIELDPKQALAYSVLSRYYWSQKQWDQWLLNVRLSVEVPSLGARAALSLAYDLSALGQHEAAYHWINKAISMEPEDYIPYLYAAHIRVTGGDYESSLVFLEKFLALGGHKDDYHTLRALTLHFMDRDDKSRNEIKQIIAVRVFSSELYGIQNYLKCQTTAREQILLEISTMPAVRNYVENLFCALGASDLDSVFSLLNFAMQQNLRVRTRLGMYDEAKLDPRWQAVQEYMDLPELSAEQIPY
jgi:TolB-like protein/DNA-binding winged helix-turn-helix (wHTH) protein